MNLTGLRVHGILLDGIEAFVHEPILASRTDRVAVRVLPLPHRRQVAGGDKPSIFKGFRDQERPMPTLPRTSEQRCNGPRARWRHHLWEQRAMSFSNPRFSLSELAILTSKEEDLPSLIDVSDGSRPNFELVLFTCRRVTRCWVVQPDRSRCAQLPVFGHRNPCGILHHCRWCTGDVSQTEKVQSAHFAIVLQAKVTKIIGFGNEATNMADDPVNWRRSILRNNSCSTAVSADSSISVASFTMDNVSLATMVRPPDSSRVLSRTSLWQIS